MKIGSRLKALTHRKRNSATQVAEKLDIFENHITADMKPIKLFLIFLLLKKVGKNV